MKHLVLILADVESDDIDAVQAVADRLVQQVRHRTTVDALARVRGAEVLCLRGVEASSLGAALRAFVDVARGTS